MIVRRFSTTVTYLPSTNRGAAPGIAGVLLLLLAAGGCGSGGTSVPGAAAINPNTSILARNQFVPNGSKAADGTTVNVTAGITEEAAKSAALTARSGTVTHVELGDEDGVAVYDIEVVSANKEHFDVKVDANTGTVLRIDTGDGEGNDNGNSGTDDGKDGANGDQGQEGEHD